MRIKGREGWYGEVIHPDGRAERRRFDKHKEATDWVESVTEAAKASHAPSFGGPSGITLGQMMGEYAASFTINKGGYAAELTRINHYVTAVGLPRLKIRVDIEGRRYLEKMPAGAAPTVPVGFKKQIDKRLSLRERTYAMLHNLAGMTVSKLTTKHMQDFFTAMNSDGLSPSTVQKEIALLKAAFNSAITTWKWNHFENPCLGIKLGASKRRFVVFSATDQERLRQALAECDNPQVWPLVELAIVTTLRKETLLKMTWDQIDLDSGQARLYAKGDWVDVTLSSRAIELLHRVPSSGDNRVFTMNSNALRMAWNGVRIKALRPLLQFRDLRHVGATFYANAGFNSHQLQKVLTHKSPRMAEIYVNLVAGDMKRVLAEAEAKRSSQELPPMHDADGPKKKPRQRKGAHVQAPEAASPENVVYVIRDGNRLVREDEPEVPTNTPPSAPSEQKTPAPWNGAKKWHQRRD